MQTAITHKMPQANTSPITSLNYWLDMVVCHVTPQKPGDVTKIAEMCLDAEKRGDKKRGVWHMACTHFGTLARCPCHPCSVERGEDCNATAPAETEATIRASYAPYDTHAEFEHGFELYNLGVRSSKSAVTISGYSGVALQAFERGMECAMRVRRLKGGLR